MNKLSNDIYVYFLNRFDDLSPDKQFHFASRLYLWSQDVEALALLRDLRPNFTSHESPADSIKEVFAITQLNSSLGSQNASALRQPYLARYPKLKAYHAVLYRLNFMQTVYDIDAKHLFGEVFDQNEVEAMMTQLLQDDEALAILSTHAINFLYLYSRLIKQDQQAFDPSHFLAVGTDQYDRHDRLHLQLLIYLYTHCIIGESQFYYRALPLTHLSTYQQMLSELEAIIAQNFSNINLDNKFEFLVCARLLDMPSHLEAQIAQEAEQSLSSEGTFLIDRHNTNPRTTNVTLEKSEHRNVLFIMANQEFKPLVSAP